MYRLICASKQGCAVNSFQTLRILAALTFGLGTATGYGEVQSFFYSGPVTGSMQVGLTPATSQQVFTGFDVTFGTVTEILNYDLTAQTLEEVGSVTVSPSSSGTFNLLGTAEPNGMGGSTNPVVGSASLTVGKAGSFSFDINYILTGDASTPFLNVGLLMPVSGTATYLGQAETGTWNLVVPAFPAVISSTSSALTFTEGSTSEYLLPGPSAMPGLVGGDGDDTYDASWFVSGVATAVPEPSPLIPGLGALLYFGASKLRLLTKKLTAFGSPHCGKVR